MSSPRQLPELFGRYRILTLLGAGGMGTVYVALDTRLDRRVALKVPHFSDEDPSVLERFRREARLAASIQHPNFCPVHDVGTCDGIDYFTMPLVEGTPLSRLLGPGRPWPPRGAAGLLRQVALAVAQLHALGIIHRDLKPANIMIRPSGEPVLMDFGLALSAQTRTRLTAAGEPLGTPAYMSPEQVRGQNDRIGPATDVYSLGVILYEMAAGRPPFTGSVLSVFAQVLHAAPPAPSALRPEAGLDFDYLCVKAMARDPARRFAGAAEFADALARYMGSDAATEGGTPLHLPVSTSLTDAAPTVVRGTSGPPVSDVAHVQCLKCGQMLLVLSDLAGQEAPCPNCRDFQDTYPVRPWHQPSRGFRQKRWLAAAGLAVLLLLGAVILRLTNDGARERTTDEDEETPLPKKENEPPSSRERINHAGMKLVRIPRGTFLMGSPPAEKGRSDDEGPRHPVEITRDFWMGVTEVTRGQFRKFADEEGYRTEFERTGNSLTWKANEFSTKDEHPVVVVTWDDALAFCKWLSKKDERTYDLPTEAEWEYACRAGTESAYSFGEEDRDQLSAHVWFGLNSKNRPQLTGTRQANPWGLFDMHGNVWEWCADGYADYPEGLVKDPRGKAMTQNRVVRGGCYLSLPKECRSANRWQQQRDSATMQNGFRVITRER